MEKGKNIPVYMLILPLFVVIGLIYGGIVQRFLPAVTVDGHTYTAVDFNYWYYTEYLDFTDEHYDDLEEMGLTPGRDLSKQACDGYDSWQDFFQEAAMRRIAETEALMARAEDEGYSFTAEDEAVFAREREKIDAYLAESGTSMQNYVQSYYDVSMTEKIFLRNLERDCLADAYKTVLLSGMTPTEAELADYIDAHPAPAVEDYRLADLYVIWFAAPTDRFTGAFEQTQADDLKVKADALLSLWREAGGTEAAFAELAERFSEDPDIAREHVDKGLLPEELDAWCGAAERAPGDVTVSISEDGLWIVYYRASGESAYAVHCREQLAQEAYDNWLSSVLPDHPLRERFGMALAM